MKKTCVFKDCNEPRVAGADGQLQADSLPPARRRYTLHSLRVNYKRDLKGIVLDTFNVILWYG